MGIFQPVQRVRKLKQISLKNAGKLSAHEAGETGENLRGKFDVSRNPEQIPTSLTQLHPPTRRGILLPGEEGGILSLTVESDWFQSCFVPGSVNGLNLL